MAERVGVKPTMFDHSAPKTARLHVRNRSPPALDNSDPHMHHKPAHISSDKIFLDLAVHTSPSKRMKNLHSRTSPSLDGLGLPKSLPLMFSMLEALSAGKIVVNISKRPSAAKSLDEF
jgi:hypothetical protein